LCATRAGVLGLDSPARTFVVFAALSGLAGGAFYPLLASLVADYFGERNAVRNFGLVYSAKMFGGLIGIGLPAFVVSSPTLMLVFVAAASSACAPPLPRDYCTGRAFGHARVAVACPRVNCRRTMNQIVP
jgi:MFS family permease